MCDLQIINECGLVGLKPRSDEGRAFLRCELNTEGWQYLGEVLYVDYRQAPEVLELAFINGLEVH